MPNLATAGVVRIGDTLAGGSPGDGPVLLAVKRATEVKSPHNEFGNGLIAV